MDHKQEVIGGGLIRVSPMVLSDLQRQDTSGQINFSGQSQKFLPHDGDPKQTNSEG